MKSDASKRKRVSLEVAYRQAEQVLLALKALHVAISWEDLPSVMRRWCRCHALTEIECPPLHESTLQELKQVLSNNNRCLCTCEGVRWYCSASKDYRLLLVLVRKEISMGKFVDPKELAGRYPMVIKECGLKNPCELCSLLNRRKIPLVCENHRKRHSA